ncbi:kinesin-like protein KIF19 [Phalacrocorax carbo]|uniref:kinesin-like protein KIF19 n=1 Tax=Phalacrocorax carbo TaxID=9209 RepID=UPI00311A7C9F
MGHPHSQAPLGPKRGHEGDSEDQQLAVALRIRPMSAAELAEGARPIADRVDEQVVVLRDPMEDPNDVLRASRSREKSYIFDVAFDSTATQETVYRATTQGLIAGIISGYNATIFAYGPTGCGKTYTMLGTDSDPGICTRALGDLFQAIKDTSGDMEYQVSMSYLEIYNEMIRDLLNPSLGCLQLREDASGTIQVAGITEVSAINAEEVMQLLARGNRQRTQEPTAANCTSSRSHAVLQVTVHQRCQGRGLHCGRLFMIDLAGSERAAQTQNRGQRMKEGAHINRSLLALGNCIKALSNQASTKYINYRDSKLTRLLKDSLGGNSRTVMIAHISPASTAFEESRNTLTYAHRAKSIRTTAKLVRRVRQSQQHAQQLEEAMRRRSSLEEQQEVMALRCHLHQLELETAETHSRTLLKGGLRHLPAAAAQHFDRHRALCTRIIHQQRQLITDHRLSVPQTLEELYETYLQELEGGPRDTSTLKGTSLPKIPQMTGTESLPNLDWDSVCTQSCEHPTLLQRDALPPLHPTGDSTQTPMFKKTPGTQQLGSTVVPTPPPGQHTVAQQHVSWASLSTWHDSSSGSGTSLEAALAASREQREMSSSSKSIMAKAAQHRSCILESTSSHPPGSAEERGGPGLQHTTSEDSLAGTATHSPGTWLRARKKGSKELGRKEELLGGRRRSRRSWSFEVTSCGLVAPKGPPLLSNTLQSHSEHGVLAGMQAASTQGPRKALPGAKPQYGQPSAPLPAPGRASTRGLSASPGTVPVPPARMEGVTGTEPSALPEGGQILCQASRPSAHPASPSTMRHTLCRGLPVAPHARAAPWCQPCCGHGWQREAGSRAGGQSSPCQTHPEARTQVPGEGHSRACQ